MKENILFYGSLRNAFDTLSRLTVQKHLTYLRTISHAGTMYDLGNYPGIQLTGTAKFVGDLFSIDDSLVLSVLDEFEGYFPRSPDQSLYIRKQISIQDSTQPVWIYEYNQSVSGLSIIPHGDWVHYWAQKNGQLF